MKQSEVLIMNKPTENATTDAIVSVIVPVCNAAYYLKKSVGSILRQTCRDLEIILVDDGSTDKSGEICDGFAAKDPRVKVIHKANGGVSSARNAGLDAASGKYVTFVDDDDWLPENAVDTLLQAMISRNADISAGMIQVIGLVSSKLMGFRGDCTVHCDNTDELTGFIQVIKEFPSACAKLMRKDVITRNRLRFDEQMNYGEDTLFMWQYISCCQVISAVSDIVYHYSKIVENNSTAGVYADKSIWIFQCFQALWQLFSEEQRKDRRVQSLLLEKVLSSFAGSCAACCANIPHNEAVSAIGRIAAYYEPYIEVLYNTSEKKESISCHTNEQKNAVWAEYVLCRDYEAVYRCFPATGSPPKKSIRKFLASVKRWCVYRFTFEMR